jgi:hypothetical protein
MRPCDENSGCRRTSRAAQKVDQMRRRRERRLSSTIRRREDRLFRIPLPTYVRSIALGSRYFGSSPRTANLCLQIAWAMMNRSIQSTPKSAAVVMTYSCARQISKDCHSKRLRLGALHFEFRVLSSICLAHFPLAMVSLILAVPCFTRALAD